MRGRRLGQQFGVRQNLASAEMTSVITALVKTSNQTPKKYQSLTEEFDPGSD